MYLSCKEETAKSTQLTTIAELAESYQISTNHLMKVLRDAQKAFMAHLKKNFAA